MMKIHVILKLDNVLSDENQIHVCDLLRQFDIVTSD